MKGRAEQGFVLLMVLVIMQITMLLFLSGSMTAQLMLTSAHHHQNRERLTRVMFEQMDEIELQGLATCIIPLIPSNVLAKMPLHWWRQRGCSGERGGVHYYYVWEQLGQETCAYDRLTLLGYVTQEMGEKIIYQSTIARAIKNPSDCEVSARQMRRPLIIKGMPSEPT
jgi:hypothetical protein